MRWRGIPLDARKRNSVTRLAGKVAIITGGGTGTGRAIARAFAREGASVAVAGRRLEKLREVISEVQKQSGAGLAMECDVSRARDVERAVKGTVERFGRLNVLVNNAGTLRVSTVEGISEEEWDRVMAVNVKGPFLMSRAVLAEFRKCGGVTMLTKAMAVDHGHENIRVNCICPSIVETELVKGLFDASEQGEARRKGRLGLIPLGRFGQPVDVAEMAVFLASEESSWLTGAAIPLDGGLTAY